MVKKWITALLTALLLCACQPPPSPLEPEPEPEPQPQIIIDEEIVPEAAALPEEVLFLVDISAAPAFVEAAQNFARRVSELTGGQLGIQVRSYYGASSHFTQGRAQLAFLDSEEDGALSGYIRACALPFLYPDYETFNMALNGEDFLALLTEDLRSRGIVPLGAFYHPGHHLITNWQPSGLQEFSQAFIAVDTATGANQGFRFLGAAVVEEEDPARRAELLLDGEIQGAELTLAQMADASWQGSDLYLTLSHHTARPVFLAMNREFHESLPPRYRAAVQEAVAYMYEDIDLRLRAEEEDRLQSLLGQGLLLYTDFSNGRREVFTNLISEGEEDQLLTKEELTLWQLVSALE